MEIKDKDGEWLGWISEDPDDFQSFSDYEWIIYELVQSYNEQAFEVGAPLLWFRKCLMCESMTHDCLTLLSKLNTDTVPMFKDKLEEIKRWSMVRLESRHPDEPKRAYHDHLEEQEMYADYQILKDSDPKEAFKVLHTLACREDRACMLKLAKAYEFGHGVEENMLRVLYWTDQSLFELDSSNQLREELKNAGVTKPLYVAGINYDGPGLSYQGKDWWLAYYKKHGLIEQNLFL